MAHVVQSHNAPRARYPCSQSSNLKPYNKQHDNFSPVQLHPACAVKAHVVASYNRSSATRGLRDGVQLPGQLGGPALVAGYCTPTIYYLGHCAMLCTAPRHSAYRANISGLSTLPSTFRATCAAATIMSFASWSCSTSTHITHYRVLCIAATSVTYNPSGIVTNLACVLLCRALSQDPR